jgi:hypothetical protein
MSQGVGCIAYNGRGLGDGLEFEKRQPGQMISRITKLKNRFYA